MATTKKKVTKKATTKKAVTKKEADVPALIDSGLDSAALAVHANYDVAQFADVALDVNENSELFSNDILIPKIWLIQAMSELRKQKKADEGQFVDSQTAEVLADEGEELRFVVLKTFKRWHTFAINGDKKEFQSSDIMTLENANWKYEEVIDGIQLKRRQVISAYVLIERDAVKGANKPYIIDFASSSKYGGRKMISDIKTLGNNGLPSFVAFFKMTSHEETFDNGNDAFVKDVQFGGYLPKATMPFLIQCRKDLDSMENQIEIDDSDLINTQATNKAETNVAANVDQSQAGI